MTLYRGGHERGIEGLEDLICYDEFWLNRDMENMGYFLNTVTSTVKKY